MGVQTPSFADSRYYKNYKKYETSHLVHKLFKKSVPKTSIIGYFFSKVIGISVEAIFG
jgi:hypothetical protein